MVTDVSTLDSRRAALRSRVAKPALGFLWHFVQMAVAMEIGMYALGYMLPAVGQADLSTRSPEASALAMTVAMVLPMAAWMRIRGHGWERTAEMTAAMTVPIVVLVAACSIGLLPHSAVAFGLNVLMWAGMLGAMLFRWSDYAQHHHGHWG
jgi:hypothetical protein